MSRAKHVDLSKPKKYQSPFLTLNQSINNKFSPIAQYQCFVYLPSHSKPGHQAPSFIQPISFCHFLTISPQTCRCCCSPGVVVSFSSPTLYFFVVSPSFAPVHTRIPQMLSVSPIVMRRRVFVPLSLLSLFLLAFSS